MTPQRHRSRKIQRSQELILGSKVQILCLISQSQVHRLSIQALIRDAGRWTCTLAVFLKTFFLVFIFKVILRFKKKVTFYSFWWFCRQNLNYQTHPFQPQTVISTLDQVFLVRFFYFSVFIVSDRNSLVAFLDLIGLCNFKTWWLLHQLDS